MPLTVALMLSAAMTVLKAAVAKNIPAQEATDFIANDFNEVVMMKSFLILNLKNIHKVKPALLHVVHAELHKVAVVNQAQHWGDLGFIA